jgi:chloramphenicol 3-O phosphotransferase
VPTDTGPHEHPGRIVILTGAPRSGKSTLARAVQAGVTGRWINWGVDGFNAGLPAELLPGIGLRPGGERPDLEPVIAQLYAGFFGSVAALSRAGLDVVCDLGLHRDYASALDPPALMRQALADLPVLVVRVTCAIDTIMARRNADPQGGFYVGGPGVPAPVARWQTAVAEVESDLVLDTSRLTPAEGAEQIAGLLAG